MSSPKTRSALPFWFGLYGAVGEIMTPSRSAASRIAARFSAPLSNTICAGSPPTNVSPYKEPADDSTNVAITDSVFGLFAQGVMAVTMLVLPQIN